MAERHAENMKEQLEQLQQSLREDDSKKRDLDSSFDQFKHSNMELELSAKEKEVSLINDIAGCRTRVPYCIMLSI